MSLSERTLMLFVMVVDVDESLLDGDDTIENATRLVNDALAISTPGVVPIEARPLSEVIAS